MRPTSPSRRQRGEYSEQFYIIIHGISLLCYAILFMPELILHSQVNNLHSALPYLSLHIRYLFGDQALLLNL